MRRAGCRFGPPSVPSRTDGRPTMGIGRKDLLRDERDLSNSYPLTGHTSDLRMLIDLRHLVRNLRRSPASAAAAVLTLSLTLGAGASIFAVVDAVLLTPPPFADPDALVTLGEILPGEPASAPRSVRYGTVEAWRERAGSLHPSAQTTRAGGPGWRRSKRPMGHT